MTLFAGATQVQKAYIGASAVNAIMHAGVNVLGVNGSFPGITDSELYLPLTNTLVPTRGASTPTFTRATVAWDFDSEGKLNLNIPSGCPRFTGARLVRNRIPKSGDFSSAEWSVSNLIKVATAVADPFGGTTACELSSAGASLDHYITGGSVTSVAYVAGYQYCFSAYLKAGSITKIQLTLTTSAFGASQYANFDLSTGVVITSLGCTASIQYISNGWYRAQIQVIATTTANGGGGVISALVSGIEGRLPITVASGNFYVAAPQNENVSGQSDQTASEYVSVGVISPPFHGAGVDGCKWFSTNKDGSAISPSVLKKYLSEPSRVNNCLWGRDATNAAWTKSNVTAAKTATGLDNVANSASRLTAAANDATLLQLLTAATGTRTTSVWIKRVSGSGTVSLTRNGGTGWTDITSSLVTGTWVPVSLTSDVGANPTVGLKMGTSGDVIDVDCFQDENGAWRTSPILTTTAAVTRNADGLNYTNAISVAQGTALCQVQSAVPISTVNMTMLATGDASVFIMFLGSAKNRAGGEIYDGVNPGVDAIGLSLNTGLRKRASRWGADIKACADGNLGVSGTFSGSLGASTTLTVGSTIGPGAQISGNIGEIHIWTPPLADAQMQQVTS